MSENSRNWQKQFKLIKKIFISSERRDEFQWTFLEKLSPSWVKALYSTGEFPVQFSLGNHPGIGTQPPYDALHDPWVEWVETRNDAAINIRLVRLSPQQCPKVAGAAAK